MSLRAKLRLFVTGVVGLVLSVNAVVVFMMDVRELNAAFEREAAAFATLAGPQALRAFGESGRRDSDGLVAGRIAGIAKGLPNLRALALWSPRGRALVVHPVGSEPPHPTDSDFAGGHEKSRIISYGGEEVLELVMPVHGMPEGPSVMVQLLVSKEAVAERIRSLALVYGGTLALLLALGALLAHRVAANVLMPVEALKEAARGLRDGDLARRAETAGASEIVELATIFNDMASRIEKNANDLGERNSELTKAYAELQALYEELTKLEKMAAVGRTAAAVSHEIDNPIGVILGTASMLKRELAGKAEFTEDLALIEAECLRCRRIVRDLLDFARPSPLGPGPVDVVDAVKLVLRGLAHHPEMRGIEFRFDPPRESQVAVADPDGVKQVLLNLLINAGKAVGGVGEIVVSADRSGPFVVVSVFDRGPGISPANVDSIFMPYFTTGSGAGLGLTVSKKLIEQDGGKLSAENREGGGSVFRAYWPSETEA